VAWLTPLAASRERAGEAEDRVIIDREDPLVIGEARAAVRAALPSLEVIHQVRHPASSKIELRVSESWAGRWRKTTLRGMVDEIPLVIEATHRCEVAFDRAGELLIPD
jgi:hypothetical protein